MTCVSSVSAFYFLMGMFIILAGLISPLIPQTECPPRTEGSHGGLCMPYTCMRVPAEYEENVTGFFFGFFSFVATVFFIGMHAHTRRMVFGYIAFTFGVVLWACALFGGSYSLPVCPEGRLFGADCALNCTLVQTVPVANPSLSGQEALIASGYMILIVAVIGIIDDKAKAEVQVQARAAAAAAVAESHSQSQGAGVRRVVPE